MLFQFLLCVIAVCEQIVRSEEGQSLLVFLELSLSLRFVAILFRGFALELIEGEEVIVNQRTVVDSFDIDVDAIAVAMLVGVSDQAEDNRFTL